MKISFDALALAPAAAQAATTTHTVRPGDTLTLREVTREDAHAAHLAQERALRQAEWMLRQAVVSGK